MMLVGVVKIDLSVEDSASGGIVASRLYGPGCSGSEPFFVPREPENPSAEEDDGYLVAYIHDENNQESMFLVMDAKSPTLETVAAVKLPGRVPTGFHGLFIKESDLNKL
ncbi:PREDICTED: probable carotenoid cleavage dioxygenase 4, chloroplastic [Erythranthe guttata]|nr:PREDICTED: probable carotenoid cleavage dioxygenase 4, chloroplastic [Erythranthe guttata]|eukprot:XP_012847329.1 PREDICTED: probable carotenoid cleavage dioxygenase 4, chloroplastic [Erythranthe guttata]